MSSRASSGPRSPSPWSDPRLRVPTADEWAAMSPAARDAAEERILLALDEYREAMAEGTPHSRAKSNAYKELADHFGRIGRKVFLATELAVFYPGELIVPDLLAVLEVEDPARERNSWRVVDEGRGLDLVLEFRNLNKKHKDLVENVRDYARLGIPEYFSFDCRAKRLRGWRLPPGGARTYTPLVPQGGLFPSQVLDLDLGVADGRLRFFKDLAQIPSSEELVSRLQKMTDTYQDQLETYQDQLEATEREREKSVAQFTSGRLAVAEMLLRSLTARGLSLTAAQRATVMECEDFGRLLGWLERSASAATVDELLAT